MNRRLTYLIVVASLIARSGDAQVASNLPSDVARTLATQRSVVQVPLAGRAKVQWGKGAPTYLLPNGASTAVLLELAEYQAPYLITISSSRRGLGRTTEIFIPSGVVFDAGFQPIADLGEEEFGGRVESLVAELRIDEALSRAKYLLLYTRGELVGQQVVLRGRDALDDAFGLLLQKGFARVERSLDASLQVDTKTLPGYQGLRTGAPSDIVRDVVQQRAVIQLPAVGRIKHVIRQDPPTFTLSGGPSSVAVLQLPEYRNPYVLSLKSSAQRSSIFVPSGLIFDADFQRVDEFSEERLSGRDDLTVELGFSENTRNARYLLVYTRGDLGGMSLRRGGIGLLAGELRWVTRSLEAGLEIETRPQR